MNYMTVKKAAEQWGISEKTVIDYCKKGLIKGAKKAGVWVLPEESQKPVVKRGRKKEYKLTTEQMFDIIIASLH